MAKSKDKPKKSKAKKKSAKMPMSKPGKMKHKVMGY